jgi:hypothetical protein
MCALHHLGIREKSEPLARTAFEVSRLDGSSSSSGGAATAVQITPDSASSAYSGSKEESGAFHAFLEHASTYAFFLFFAAAIYFSFLRLSEQGRFWLVVLARPLGLVAGDFVSGFVHWLADTYGSERTPLVGASFIKWFRLHHVHPKDICTHNFITTNGNTCIPAAPLVGFCLPLIWEEDASATRVFFALTTVLMTAATVATNQFHKWAHADTLPRVARWLQNARLILSPAHHSRHHAAPFDAHYCITNGWMNPLLDKIKFFGRLERALEKFGLKHQREGRAGKAGHAP